MFFLKYKTPFTAKTGHARKQSRDSVSGVLVTLHDISESVFLFYSCIQSFIFFCYQRNKAKKKSGESNCYWCVTQSYVWSICHMRCHTTHISAWHRGLGICHPPSTLCTAMTGYWLGLVGHTQLGFVHEIQMKMCHFYVRTPTITELDEKTFRPDFGKQEAINAGSGPDG